MTWFLLAILASLTWAIVQLVDKTLITDDAPSPKHYWIISGVAALAPVVVMPVALPRLVVLPEKSILILAMFAGVCYFVSNAFFFRAVLRIDASISSAALAAVPSLTAVGSWLILNESFSWFHVAGIVAITLGVFVMSNFGSGNAKKSKIPPRAWVFLASSEIILVVEYLVEGAVVKHISPLSAFFWSRVGVILCVFLVSLTRPRLVREALQWVLHSKKGGLLTTGNECLDVLAIALLLAACRWGP